MKRFQGRRAKEEVLSEGMERWKGMAEPFPFLEFLDENSDFLHAADIGGAKPVPLSGLLALRAHVDIFCGVFDTFG